MTYRSDVDALTARTDALAAELETKTQELESARSLLDEAVAKSKLPILPNLKIATPCSADWAAMSGDERVRACGSCNKNVYNISTLTREEVEALIIEKEGSLCVRYFQRHDGTILLKDCSIGIGQKRKRRLIAAGAVALLGGGVFSAIKLSKQTPATSAAIDDSPTEERIVPPHSQDTAHEDEVNTPPELDPGPVYVRMGAVAIRQAPQPEAHEGDKDHDGNVIVK